MKKLLMLALAAMIAPSFADVTETIALSDAEILGVIQAVNQAEIDSGNMADTTSSNSDVKSFARLMLKEHYKAYAALKDLSVRQNITPQNNWLSDKVKADEEKHLESLDRQQGILFDLDYASHEMEFHEKMLRLWDEKLIPQAQNEELKRLLADVRSAVVRHLEEAKKLKASLGRKK
jgi:putative membrane protein